MTRLEQRLKARFERERTVEARDAYIGDQLHRYHEARITPIHRSIRDRGMWATARQAFNAGISLIDFYVCCYGKMPRLPI